MPGPVAASGGAPVVHYHQPIYISDNVMLSRDVEVANEIADRIKPYLNKPSLKAW